MKIDMVDITSLSVASWNSVYTLKPEKRQMKASIKKFGVLSPVVVQRSTNVIIDGKTRAAIALELGHTSVPVVFVDCDDVDAMVLHVRLNRYRGEVVARRLSTIIRRILVSHKYTEDELRAEFGMTRDEFDVLADGTILKHRKISEHVYASAWVPIESSSGEDMRIERPTGHPESKS